VVEALRVSSSDRFGLLLQPGQQVNEVVQQEVGHLPTCSVTHHDAQRSKVLAIGGEGVGRYLPATFPQSCGDVEDAVVGDVVVEGEREYGQLVAPGEQPERSELLDPRRRVGGVVATLLLDLPEALPA